MAQQQSRGLARIGVVVPVSNTNLEPDMALLAPPGVSVHFSRSGGYDVDAIPDEKQMQLYSDSHDDTVVDDLRICRSDVILYGCTSATLSQGPAYDAAFRKGIEERTGIPAITAASALVGALGNLGVRRFAFTSPYVASLNNMAISYLEAFGMNCVGRADTPEPLGNDAMAAVTPSEVLEMAKRADHPEAQAIVLSCTDFRAVEAVEAIEAACGKPVVTSNQALMLWALRHLGLSWEESPLSAHLLTQRLSSDQRLEPGPVMAA